MFLNILSAEAIFQRTDHINAGQAALLAIIGILLVFAVLIILMLVVWLMGKIFDGSEKLRTQHPEWNEKIQSVKSKMMFWKKADAIADAPKQEACEQEYASGSCGELKLVNTDERDAAMIMAIVADTTGTPLNELRFKSIKRVETEGEEK